MDHRQYEAQYCNTYPLDSEYPANIAHVLGAMEAAWGTLLAHYLQKILLADLHVAITLPHNQIIVSDMCRTHPYAQLQGSTEPS